MKIHVQVAILCFIAINLLAQPNNSSSKTDNNRADNTKTASALEHDDKGRADTEKSDAGSEKWYTALKKPDWWIVIIAFFTGAAIAYQAREMTRTTKAMEKSTGVMMSIEQGRLVTDWDQVIHIDMSPNSTTRGTGILLHYFNWAYHNVGRTEVQLANVWGRFISLPSLADLPQNPDYGAAGERVYQGEPLQPNAKIPQTEWFSTPLETSLLFDEMQEKHRSGKCILYAYGYAKYFDVWGRPHETRFGIVRVVTDSITADVWVAAGPPAYNKSN